MSYQLVHTFENGYSRPDIEFEALRKFKNFNFVVFDRWLTGATSLHYDFATTFQEDHLNRNSEQIRSTGDSVAKIQLDILDNHLSVYVAAENEENAVRLLRSLKQEYPHKEPQEGLVPITFWANTKHGPRAYGREITANTWDEIERNYPSALRSNLNRLIKEYVATPDGGKLLLFSGPAGTGKTHFVRTLAREWQDRFDMHYVTDPNEFFGGGAEYLFDVLMAGDTNKWKLMVCEDTGELVSQDAKIHTGQALSRFLNLCDGMIGQGLRIQMLLTTNEDISRFHEAVIRPGRMAFNLPFPRFSRGEASEWLESPVTREMTLAELYAVKRGEEIPSERRVGII